MYRLVKDHNNHLGIYCKKCKKTSWNTTDARSLYCPYCHKKFNKMTDNYEYLAETEFSSRLFYYFRLFFYPTSLYSLDDTDDCPLCNEAMERGDADPYTPGIQSKLAMELKKIKNPKERSEAWLKSVKK